MLLHELYLGDMTYVFYNRFIIKDLRVLIIVNSTINTAGSKADSSLIQIPWHSGFKGKSAPRIISQNMKLCGAVEEVFGSENCILPWSYVTVLVPGIIWHTLLFTHDDSFSMGGTCVCTWYNIVMALNMIQKSTLCMHPALVSLLLRWRHSNLHVCTYRSL